jgi:xanthine permease XanP
MPRKPSNLLYSVDERPPFMVILVLAVQHLFFLGMGLVIPVMIMRGYGAPPEQIGSVVSLSMIAAGIATIIQSLNRERRGAVR